MAHTLRSDTRGSVRVCNSSGPDALAASVELGHAGHQLVVGGHVGADGDVLETDGAVHENLEVFGVGRVHPCERERCACVCACV